MFKFQLENNESFLNKSIDVLVENELIGQKKMFGRNQYMNSVIFEGNESLIGKNVKIGKNCSIGHNSIIEKNVSIGDNCSIGSNVIIRNTFIKKFYYLYGNKEIN